MDKFKMQAAENMVTKMIDWTKANTAKIRDFSVGSKVRTIYEAVAVAMEEFYYRVYEGMKTAIEEGIYTTFNFGILRARRATGTVSFLRSTPAPSDLTIAMGTIVSTVATAQKPAVRFRTTELIVLPTGEMGVGVPVEAEQEGTIGNVSAGTVTTLITKPAGIESVSNTSGFINGRDQETRDARRRRFRDYVMSLFKATKEALVYGAKKVEGVTDAAVVENPVLYFLQDGVTDVSESVNDPYNTVFPTAFAVENPTQEATFYIGSDNKFTFLYFNFETVGSGLTGVWEYYTGAVWSTLSVSDTTNALVQNGVVKFSAPADWFDISVSEQTAFWIRFRLTATGGTSPTLKYIFIAPPPGYVDLYVSDLSGAASSELLDAVITSVEPFRGAGITVNVRQPTIVEVPITVEVMIGSTYEALQVEEAVKSEIVAYLNTFKLGQNLVINDLRSAILNTSFGAMVRWANVTAPTRDILTSKGDILRADEANITVTVVV